MNEIEALSILSETKQLGPIKINRLISHFGSGVIALAASQDELLSLKGFSRKIVDQWGWWEKDQSWQENLELAEKEHIKILACSDPAYPKDVRFPLSSTNAGIKRLL